QNNIDSLQISKEKTTFNFKEDNLCWWIPGDWDSYEHLYTKSKISEINATSKRNHPNLISSYIPYNAVNTPVTMKTPKGYYLSLHEAALYNYPGMTLKVDTNKLSMTSELVGCRDKKIKAKVKLPFKTPWRTIQVAKKPENLITSDLILNLNEPNKLKNIDWIKPMKYVGIWWQMHVGAWSWDFGTGKHGATTENTKKYIDFASNNNIQGILVEGWNKDWKKWYSGIDREKIFSFTEPYPDYDLEEIINYAKKKGVELIVHHETASAPRAYEKQMNEAYKMMKKNDLHYIKTGYVGNIIPQGEHHHGQWMVNHYNKVIQTVAKYNIAVDIHEPIKQTGIRRTYPNLLSEEGVRGQEFNAWSEDGGNPPEHISNVVFTRMLAGPIDYTPGIFNLKMEPYKKERRINTTLAHQLALYVVIYSPIQMVPDFIESYENNSAFEFIKAVPTDWDTTLVLNGEIGDYVTIARKQKGSENWFVGTISDEHPREININFNFLKNRQNYTAIIYKDTKNSNWKSNPDDYQIDTLEINRKNNVKLYL
ncbi:MAG TPA: glycoside hydrolase family 97 protein, partial [Bacteroidetes bacterium]|nr:glycoside hydrolase family 97 protein [Bacteroidota bacterium]